jgi:hypothetical protein
LTLVTNRVQLIVVLGIIAIIGTVAQLSDRSGAVMAIALGTLIGLVILTIKLLSSRRE